VVRKEADRRNLGSRARKVAATDAGRPAVAAARHTEPAGVGRGAAHLRHTQTPEKVSRTAMGTGAGAQPL